MNTLKYVFAPVVVLKSVVIFESLGNSQSF